MLSKISVLLRWKGSEAAAESIQTQSVCGKMNIFSSFFLLDLVLQIENQALCI